MCAVFADPILATLSRATTPRDFFPALVCFKWLHGVMDLPQETVAHILATQRNPVLGEDFFHYFIIIDAVICTRRVAPKGASIATHSISCLLRVGLFAIVTTRYNSAGPVWEYSHFLLHANNLPVRVSSGFKCETRSLAHLACLG